MKIYQEISELIGNTPLLHLARLEKKLGLNAEIVAKLECFNPLSSVKDRIALGMLEDAEKSGRLAPGGCIIEPTSGNTGIGLAYLCCVRGYRLILTMPETMSIERRKLLTHLGAEIVLTEGPRGMQAAVDKAQELQKEIPGSVILSQFDNPANPASHMRTTAIELLNDTEGKLDIFVAGVGSGGTVTGVGRTLKEKLPQVKIVAVEPFESQVIAGKTAGPHKIQGIGANFVPKNFDRSIVDEVFPVEGAKAIETARLLARTEGVLAGISSGAALYAATVLSNRPENKGKRIAVLLPDTGERYLSTELFA